MATANKVENPFLRRQRTPKQYSISYFATFVFNWKSRHAAYFLLLLHQTGPIHGVDKICTVRGKAEYKMLFLPYLQSLDIG